MSEKSFLARDAEHYKRIGITKEIQLFEDGLRTDPSQSGHYEWWYFDAHLDDGATLVVTFYTKPFENPSGGLQPLITIDLTLPDGRTINKVKNFDSSVFSASKKQCDISIGENSFIGDLHEYHITATIDEISIDVALTGKTDAWRPDTGHIFYGDNEDLLFAWLPSVPYGDVKAVYSIENKKVTTTGSGYHDHNWGNAPLTKIVNNWYWGRGKAKEYTFITAEIVGEKKYGYKPITIFMLAKDGKVIADDSTKVRFEKSALRLDKVTNKPVANYHSYTYKDGDQSYTLAYNYQKTTRRDIFIDTLSGIKKIIARLIGFDGAYLRFEGTLDVLKRDNEKIIEEVHNPAIWELMYFGKTSHEKH